MKPGIVKGGGEAGKIHLFTPFVSIDVMFAPLVINYTAVELVHELAEYLSRRYPKDFSVVRHSQRFHSGTLFCDWGWEGAPPIKTVTMNALGLSYDLPLSVQDGSRAGERAMEIAGLL